MVFKRRGIVGDEARNGGEPWRGFDGLGARMHGGDGGRELAGERLVELAALGDMIERVVLVEPLHLDGPLDRFARAVKRRQSRRRRA